MCTIYELKQKLQCMTKLMLQQPNILPFDSRMRPWQNVSSTSLRL